MHTRVRAESVFCLHSARHSERRKPTAAPWTARRAQFTASHRSDRSAGSAPVRLAASPPALTILAIEMAQRASRSAREPTHAVQAPLLLLLPRYERLRRTALFDASFRPGLRLEVEQKQARGLGQLQAS